uniref:NFATC2-interacting protein n=1 Tax=Tetraodon nigroviridis TaxID=99883 RepID=H3C2F7_TETNG
SGPTSSCYERSSPQVTESSRGKPPPKRRRILDPSSVVPVSVYSNQVSSGLQLELSAAEFSGRDAADDGADDTLWSPFPRAGRAPTASTLILSDSEDEAGDTESRAAAEAAGRLSPSPPTSPVKKHSRNVQKKIGREVDRMLQSVNSFLSPPAEARTSSSTSRPPGDDESILRAPEAGPGPYSPPRRQFPLKVRCRADCGRSRCWRCVSSPLWRLRTRCLLPLAVPPHRLLLLREEAELRVDATVGELGLGIADIIECVVMAAEDRRDVISVRLQSKDRNASQEFSIHRDTPLGSVFSQYLSRVPSSASDTVCFYFDGSRVKHSQTPAELDMEDGDMVEVWL